MANRAERLLLAALSCSPASIPLPPPLAGEDWERLLEMAGLCGLYPQLYLHLCQGAMVPAPIAARLGALHRINAMRSLRLRKAALEAAGHLEQQGIPCCLLKGAALQEMVFGGDWCRRFSADIDLLVARADLPAARGQLTRLGCRVAPDSGGHHHLPAFALHGYPLELHHAICRPTLGVRPDMAGILRRRVRAHATSPFWVLSPTDQLCHLCLHLAGSHGFGPGLRGLHDIGLLVLRAGQHLDWEWLAARAREPGWPLYLYHALQAAASLLGAPVPPGVLARLRRALPYGAASRALTQQVIRQQLLPWRWPRRHLPAHFAANLCYSLVAPLPPGARLQRLLEAALVPTDWWSTPVPRRLPAPRCIPYPLWLGTRAVLVTGRYAWRLLGISPLPTGMRAAAPPRGARHGH